MTAFIRICLLVASLTLVLLGGPASAAARTLLVLGDSLSAAYGMETDEGWVSLLRERLDEHGYPHEVVNVSLSGETTGGGLARLPDALERHQPDIVILELGGNDGLRGYPIARIRANLEQMIELALEADAEVLLAGMQIPPNYGQRYVSSFQQTYQTLAHEHDIRLVPFLLEGIAAHEEWMQADGIHPRPTAQPDILDNVWPELAPLLDDGR